MDFLDTGTILHSKNYNYRIIRKLGQGSFGITYLASVKMTGTLGYLDADIYVAIKEFFMKGYNGREGSSVTSGNTDGTFAYYKSKFIHEAENLSKLNNSGIIKVIELFEENSTAYYVMEYVSEGSLDDCITKNKRFAPAQCINYARGICNALHYMHSRQFLHLDLKPNNIMLRKNGEVVLIDFGLSKRFDANGNPETSTTVGHGTPGYAPLEQQHYKKEPGAEFPATMDIYALGATMFKMLTGQRAPEASSILNDGFPANELTDIGTPQEIIDVIEKCMSPMKKERYQSTLELGNALKKLDSRNYVISDRDNVTKDTEENTYVEETVSVMKDFPHELKLLFSFERKSFTIFINSSSVKVTMFDFDYLKKYNLANWTIIKKEYDNFIQFLRHFYKFGELFDDVPSEESFEIKLYYTHVGTHTLTLFSYSDLLLKKILQNIPDLAKHPESRLLEYAGIVQEEETISVTPVMAPEEFDEEEWEYDEDTLMGKIERLTGGAQWVKDVILTLGILVVALLFMLVLFQRAL